MKPEEIASLILECHLNKTPAIEAIANFRIDIQLDYSGRMAKGAYRLWRNRRNVGRKKIGCFDFKIFRKENNEFLPMVHDRIITDVGSKVNKNSLEQVFLGKDPHELGCDKDAMVVLQEAQLTMLEQEINWGDECFQSWSRFLPSKGKRPRDFVMAYFRRIYSEPDFLKGIYRQRAPSGTFNTLPPPYGKEWKPYQEPDKTDAMPWLTGELLECFRKVANTMPDNPEYAKSY
jgi:hypothetical protein